MDDAYSLNSPEPQNTVDELDKCSVELTTIHKDAWTVSGQPAGLLDTLRSSTSAAAPPPATPFPFSKMSVWSMWSSCQATQGKEPPMPPLPLTPTDEELLCTCLPPVTAPTGWTRGSPNAAGGGPGHCRCCSCECRPRCFSPRWVHRLGKTALLSSSGVTMLSFYFPEALALSIPG